MPPFGDLGPSLLGGHQQISTVNTPSTTTMWATDCSRLGTQDSAPRYDDGQERRVKDPSTCYYYIVRHLLLLAMHLFLLVRHLLLLEVFTIT